MAESDFDVFQEIDDSFDVEGDDGFLAFDGFQEGKVVGVVVEKILGEDGSCIGIPEKVELRFKVRVAIGVVGADALAGKMLPRGLVETRGQFVGERVPFAGVGAPAAGFHPLGTVTGCVGVDADDDDTLDGLSDLAAHAVGAVHSVRQRDVGFLGCENLDIVATETEMFGDGIDDDAVELILPESTVRRAFAWSVNAVTGIEDDFGHSTKN